MIGTARKILRKDKGLNGDLDRLPLLTWVMFLKFLDDLEVVHEEEAELDGKPYQPIIEAPYRWRDWAAREDGITGDELLAFINQDERGARRWQRGPGLFAYLRGLGGQGEKGSQREVIATVFKGVQNRMVSGYLLRDIINKINGIHFSASEEIHTLVAPVRVDAARDARRGRRLRRVLHAAPGGALHGAGDRPAPRRDRARPGLRHRRLPGRGLRPHRASR